jgi:hypothetical protein
MAKILIPFALAAIGGGVAMTAAMAADPRPSRAARAEAQLAKDIARLQPQAEVDCIDTRWNRSSLQAVGSKLIYRVGRDRIYVTDTGGGCERVAQGDALVTRQFSTRLCRGDIATTVNLPARIQTGSCSMGSFTPYTKG